MTTDATGFNVAPGPSPQMVTFQTINDQWPIAWFQRLDDGLHFECDDGDTGVIRVDGSWEWTSDKGDDE